MPKPNILNVVKVDGRWAQIVGDGNYIIYLNDLEQISINWDEYNLTKTFKCSVNDAIFDSWETMTEEEINNIHCGPEDTGDTDLKLAMMAFGAYEKK